MRDQFASCPRCEAGLDGGERRLQCGHCQGVLIIDQALFDLISEAQIQALLSAERSDPWRREPFARKLALEAPQPGDGVRLACPRCRGNMAKHSLYGVEVDRCEAHGVWLDGDHELRRVLENAASRI